MTPTILLIGGGTGGHIYPLLAAAERLREQPCALISVCSTRAVDQDVLRVPLTRGAIDAVVPIPAAPLAFSPGGLWRLARSWSPSVKAIVREIERAAGPVVAVSTGGFVSVPACAACRKLGVPVVLVALDAPPGKATRWLARHAAARLNAAPQPLPGFESIGPIVRTAALANASPEDARRSLGLDPNRKTLVVFGGSQGAQTVNRFIAAFCAEHGEHLDAAGWQVLHQCGAAGLDEMTAFADTSRVPMKVAGLIDRVGDAWAAADLVVSRAGAGAVAEATLAGKPVVFLPYPFHADQHQVGNARPLVEAGAAVCLTDHVEPDANSAAHAGELLDLITNADRRGRLAEAFGRLPQSGGGARRIAELAHELVGTSPSGVV